MAVVLPHSLMCEVHINTYLVLSLTHRFIGLIIAA